MRSRAVWRARPDDPRTALGWAVRDLRGTAQFVVCRLEWILRLAAFVALGRGQWFLAMASFGLSSAPEDWLKKEGVGLGGRRLGLRPLLIESLVTLPPPATPYPCRIEVCKGGTLLGSDMGIVTFLDGWLHFEGLRTSFALRRPDIVRRSEDRLDLSEGGEVAFVPQDRLALGDMEEKGLATRFRANLGSWMRSDPPQGESILPPARIHPTGVVRAGGNLTATLIVGGLVIELASLIAPVWAIVAALVFGVGLLRSLRDLVRVRRLLRPACARPVVE